MLYFTFSYSILFLQTVKSVRNKSAYYAEEIHEAMKGMGTKDNNLIRLLIMRAEVKNHHLNLIFISNLKRACLVLACFLLLNNNKIKVDLPVIKQQYEQIYGKSLYKTVKSELSGDYEKLFLALIGKE